MPFVLIIIGLLMVIIAIRGTQAQAADLLRSEFTGQNNFITWGAAVGAVGAVGYIKPIQPLSRAFLVLIIIGMLLANEGIFDALQRQLFNRQGSASPANAAPPGGSPGGVAPVPNAAPTSGSFPAGVGNNAWWGAGLPAASGRQQPCPPGTRAQGVPGWIGGTTRCVPE